MKTWEPNFENMELVCARKKPHRPVLVEFFASKRVWEYFMDTPYPHGASFLEILRYEVKAHNIGGYDYTLSDCPFMFSYNEFEKQKSFSSESRAVIFNRKDFENYLWPQMKDIDFDPFEQIKKELPGNMKLIAPGPDGILETIMGLCGYEGLSLMLYDDPVLAQEIFNTVGSILTDYYRSVARFESVGACLVNDDWGFKTQTMLKPDHMRQYVIPWHKKMVEVIHQAGKPALMHSCGNLESVMPDIIDTIGFEGKHSFEDTILPVEDVYDKYSDRIAILGGIDVDFLCRRNKEEIVARCRGMLERSETKGGYALGSGNSVTDYVPLANYLAMRQCAFDFLSDSI